MEMSILNFMVSRLQKPHGGLSKPGDTRAVRNNVFIGLTDFLQSQRFGPSNYNRQPSNDNSDQEINEKLTKLETSVASLIDNAASDKSQLSDRIEEIESNVIAVKTRLGAKIDHVAVSKLLSFFTFFDPKDCH